MSQGNADNRLFKNATGEWGSKARKEEGFKRREAMKNATREQLLDAFEQSDVEVLEFESQQDARTRQLEQELKAAKQEVKRWKDKADAWHQQWRNSWGWKAWGHKEPSVKEMLDRISQEWRDIKNANC